MFCFIIPLFSYQDQDGNLRYGESDRNRDEEIIAILQADCNDDAVDPSQLWMIIPSRWVKQWILFAHFKGIHTLIIIH